MSAGAGSDKPLTVPFESGPHEPVRASQPGSCPEDLTDPIETEQHLDSAIGARDALRAFYRRTGGSFYIACGLSVHYPGEPHFTPDILAVRDVPSRPRDSYLVARECRGLDVVIEVLHHGDRKRDLSDNVSRYARLGIPEYFVADLWRRRILGYHLLTKEARVYSPLPGAEGRLRSAGLGLDLALFGGQLRFYSGTATLPTPAEEVERLGEQVLKEQEQAAEAHQDAAAAQREAAAVRDQLDALRGPMVDGLLTLLRLRGLTLSVIQEEHVRECDDMDLLARWLKRAASAAPEELFLDGRTYLLPVSSPIPPRSMRW